MQMYWSHGHVKPSYVIYMAPRHGTNGSDFANASARGRAPYNQENTVSKAIEKSTGVDISTNFHLVKNGLL
jgi:hypothetical protein